MLLWFEKEFVFRGIGGCGPLYYFKFVRVCVKTGFCGFSYLFFKGRVAITGWAWGQKSIEPSRVENHLNFIEKIIIKYRLWRQTFR